MNGFNGGGYLDSYLASSGSSTKKRQGGYLGNPGAGSVDWSAFDPITAKGGSGGFMGGSLGGNYRQYIPAQGLAMGGTGAIRDTSALDAANAQTFGVRQHEHDLAMQKLKAQLSAQMQLAQMNRPDEDEQFRRTLALREFDANTQREGRAAQAYYGYGLS